MFRVTEEQERIKKGSNLDVINLAEKLTIIDE